MEIEENITITKEEYVELLVSSETLRRLYKNGVVYWDKYESSMFPEDDVHIYDFHANLLRKFYEGCEYVIDEKKWKIKDKED